VLKNLEYKAVNLSEETHWEKAARTRMGKYLTNLETSFILDSITPSKTHMVIDVGAEAGRFSLMSTNSKATVIGIDIDSYSLRRLKQKNRDVAVIQADARKIPLKNATFDALFMIEVLDYIPELTEAFSECRRILQPNSPLILSFGNQASLKAKLRKLHGKSYMHSYGQVMKCLIKTGFTVKRKKGYSWLPLSRMSNSQLVHFLAGLERLLRLRQIPSLSPWVIVYAINSK
jgi:ubiquinone/menaquinone biosynthesis C-methylase UbiE